MASAEVLNAIGEWLYRFLGRLSLELAILALAVAMVVWALRLRSPALRHAFWGLVLAKPLVTLLVASPLSLYWFLHQAPRPVYFPSMPPVARTLMPFTPMVPDVGRPETPASPLASAPPVSVPQRSVPLNAYGWLFLGWSTAAVALAVRLAAGGAFVRYLTRKAERARQGPVAELAGRAAATMGLRRPVPVFLCGDGCGPLLAGLVRPRVLLPRSLAAELPANRLELVLAHEMAHARRGDNLILAAQRLVETLLFFHPAVWCCGRLMAREAEAACDERVVSAYGDSGRYADSLTRVAELRYEPMHRLLASTFAATESHCARRVRRVLQGSRRRMTLGLTVGSAVCLVGLALTGLPSAAERPIADQPQSVAGIAASANLKEDTSMALKSRREQAGPRPDGSDRAAPAEGPLEPVIVQRHRILVAGLITEGEIDGNAIRGLWDRFMPRMGELTHASGPPSEVWRDLPGAPGGKAHELMAGRQVTTLEDLPEGITGWHLPGGTYAEVVVAGVDRIGPICQRYWNEWLPASTEYEQNGLFMVQEYRPSATGGEDVVHLLWPVRPKAATAPASTPTARAADGLVVLDGFGRIGFYRGQGNPEDHPLPGVVRAVCEYLGNDAGLPGFANEQRGPWQWETCALVHGVSGQAFHHSWGHWGPQEPIWGADLMSMYEKSFAAVGLTTRALLKSRYSRGLNWSGAVSDDDGEYRRWVVESLRNGMPVVALKLFGPPEPGIISGYDEDGAVIVGWDYFQGEDQVKADPRVSFDDSGRYVKRDWVGDLEGIILVTGRAPRPEPRGQYREALARDLRQMMIPGTEDQPLGFAAYHAWARDLLDDAWYAGADEARLKERHGMQHAVVGEVAERRAYGASFLRQAAEALPEAAGDLSKASECFDLMHDLCWRAWQTSGETHLPDAAAATGLASRATRQELASIVLMHRDLDLRAARHIGRALLALGVPASELPEIPSLPEQRTYLGTRALPYVSADLDQPVVSAETEMDDPYRNGKYVRGAPPYRGFGERVCSLAGALETALAATPRPSSYADLMGYSGLAFRTRWFHNPQRLGTPYGKGPWHPVSPHGEQPEVLQAIAAATGWQFRLETFASEDRLRRDQLTTDLVLSVYSGLPVVIGYRTDLGVAHGYHIWSMNYLIRHQQAPQDAPWRIKYSDEGIHGPFIFLAGYHAPSSEREAFAASLRLALHNQQQRPAEGPFLFGEAAQVSWRQALVSADTLSQEDRGLLFMANQWALLHLWDARRSAVSYLEARRALVDGAARSQLDVAIEAYRREADLLGAFLQDHRELVAWWGGQRGVEAWSAGVRAAQLELMEQAAGHEARAVEAMAAVVREL